MSVGEGYTGRDEAALSTGKGDPLRPSGSARFAMQHLIWCNLHGGGDRMTRREFIAPLGSFANWSQLGNAEQLTKIPMVRFLGSGTPSTYSQWVNAFLQRLRELDRVEGRNIAIEYRWAEGSKERYTEIAAEFVRIKVDVI